VNFIWNTGNVLAAGRFESGRFSSTANITKLKPYFLLDINYNQKLGKVFTAFAAVRNALNVSYESFDDYPMPGISITIGIRANVE
jgi:outer membrane receptor protein involved in Fe transport